MEKEGMTDQHVGELDIAKAEAKKRKNAIGGAIGEAIGAAV